SRGIWLHVGKLHAVLGLAKVRDRSEVRPIAAAAATGDRLLLGYYLEHGVCILACQLYRDVANKIEQPSRRRRVDLVPRIGGLVIIGVQPREEEQDGNLLGHKRSMLAGRIPPRLCVDLAPR